MITFDLIASVLEAAKKRGAEHAKVLAGSAMHHEVSVRKGSIKKMASSKSESLVLALLKNCRCASMSTSDVSPDALQEVVEKTIAMLAFSEEDPANVLASADECVGELTDLDLFDSEVARLSPADHTRVAKQIEAAAFGTDQRVRNSRASASGSSVGVAYYGSTNGIFRKYEKSVVSLSLECIAESDHGMQTGAWDISGTHAAILSEAEEVGRTAAKRAARQLGGRKVKTQEAPVVFDIRTAAQIIGQLANAASGSLLYARESFLCDQLGAMIASPHFTLRDDATLASGIGSRPFDNDGVITKPATIVDQGVLKSYLLDVYAAKKLGMRSTGHSVPGGTTNLFLAPGISSPESIIAGISNGFYVTEMLGFGVDFLTGEFSRGARGLWIEGGEFAYPVEGVTIAGNLKDIYRSIEAIGNDLQFFSSVSAPTIKVSSMIIAGS